MDKRRNHIIFWVVFFVFHYLLNFLATRSYLPTQILAVRITLMNITVLLSFYFFIKYVLPETLLKSNYFLLLTSIIVSITITFSLNYTIFFMLHIALPHFFDKPPSINRNFSFAIISIQQSLNLAFPFYIIQNYIKKEYEKFLIQERFNVLNNTIQYAELSGLKNQINPHFFYNILNFLYSQSLSFSGNLSKSILKLSEIMRYTVRESDEQGKKSLEEGIIFIKNYIELEDCENNYYPPIQFEVTGNPKFRRVNPLSFQPFLNLSFTLGNPFGFYLNIKANQIFLSSSFIKDDEIEIASILEEYNKLKQKISNTIDCSINFENNHYYVQMNVIS